MNFIKGILGLKKPDQKDKTENLECPLEKEFLDFQIEATVYCYSKANDSRETLYKKCKITFDQDEVESFSYFLYLLNSDKKVSQKEEEDNSHYFPIKEEMKFKYFESKRGNQKMVFDYHNIEFQLDEDTTIRILIDITDEGDRCNALIFNDLLAKLIYQQYKQQSYKEVKHSSEYQKLIEEVERGTMQKGDDRLSHMSTTSFTSQQQQKIQEKEEENISDNTQQTQTQNQDKNNNNKYPQLDDSEDQIKSLQKDIDNLNLSQNQNKKDQTISEKFSKGPTQYDREKLSEIMMNQINLKATKMANTAKYFLFDENQQLNVIEEGVVFVLSQEAENIFNFTMTLVNQQNKVIYSRSVNSEMNYRVDMVKNQIQWLHIDLETDKGDILVLQFDAPNVSTNIQFALSQAVYENNMQISFQKCVKQQDEQQFVSRIFNNNVLVDDKDEEEQKMEIEEQQTYQDEMKWGEITDSYVFDNNNQEQQVNFDGKNVIMEQGKQIDRTFLCKDGTMGVYRTVQKDTNRLDFLTNLPVLKDLSGKKLNPVKMQMMEQDQKVIVMNQFNDKQLYQLDLERGGQIVREFQIDGFNSISDICPESKHSEMTHNPVFNCCNSRNVFKMDPRVSKADVAEIKTEGKAYAANNQFSCMTSNKAGNIAIGSRNGDIRLYKNVGQNAKCLYPGFGDEIKSIDSTKDGKWILATCKNYLILLPSFSKQGKDGFNASLKYEDRRIPKQLRLLPEHMSRYRIKKIDFKPAKFDESGGDKQEQFIITSTGKYSIIWNFSGILRGDLYDYTIQAYNEEVQDAQFKFNEDNQVFAALNNKVQLQNTKKGKKNSQKKH